MSAAVIPFNRQVLVETIIHIVECASCTIDFGIGDAFMARRRKDHKDFYCPNGHPNMYREDNEAEKWRKEAANMQRQRNLARLARDAAVDQANAAERSRRATKAAHTRTKKRIAGGVCPCCNRTFVDLGRHMHGQHPDYAEGSA